MPTVISQSLFALSWAEINILTKKRYDFLLSEFGNLENAWENINETLLRKLGCKEQTIARVLEEKKTLNVETSMETLKAQGMHFLTIEDDTYPELLKNIADPPVFLFGKGDLIEAHG